MKSGQIAGSRWGMKGKEDLGGGYAVIYQLEAGINVDDGSSADDDRYFNRIAVVGIQSPIGTFHFGRYGALVSGTTGGIFANKASPFGITWGDAGSNKILSGSAGTRLDNQIRYESASINGFKGYLQYSNAVSGDDAKPTPDKTRYGAVGASLDVGDLYVVSVIDKTAYAHLEGRKFKDSTTYNIAFNYDLTKGIKGFAAYQYGTGLRKLGGLANLKTTKPYLNKSYKSHAMILGANVALAGGTVKVALGYLNGKDQDDKKYERYQAAVGYLYPLSKRTSLYAALTYSEGKKNLDRKKLYHDNKGVGAGTETMFLSGIRHTF